MRGEKLSDIILDDEKYLNHMLINHKKTREEYLIYTTNFPEKSFMRKIIDFGNAKKINIALYLWVLNLYSEREISQFLKYYSIMLINNNLHNKIMKNMSDLYDIICDEVIMITMIITIQYYFL